MKKLLIISTILFLMTNFAGCSGNTNTEDGIYEKIHKNYYNIKSYKTNCKVTAFTKAGSNTYDCTINYDHSEDSYTMVSDDMKIFLTKEKCVISKGENTIESPSSKEDMYIFVNTFFKSYYECEDTAVSVNSGQKSDLVLLECSIINSTQYASSMKLWINQNNVKPEKMQILDSDGAVNTEIKFKDFNFID